jgi:ABC-2 type transport system ATP-binding protein
MADRIGIIRKGELILVEEKTALMQKLGRKQLTLQLAEPLNAVPKALAAYNLELSDDGLILTYTFETERERTKITGLLRALDAEGIVFSDLHTSQSSLEDIFVSLVRADR